MSTSNKGEDRSYPNKYYPSLARIEWNIHINRQMKIIQDISLF